MRVVTVPATSANMSVGFDSFGIAVNIYNRIEYKIIGDGLKIIAEDSVPDNEQNLVYRACLKTAESVGRSLPPIYMNQYGDIPKTRGLGSSAACVVGGIMLADDILNTKLSKAEMLEIATGMEGHPDNAAPALFGGVCITVREGDGLVTKKIAPAGDLALAVIMPDFPLPTERSRAVLPETVSMKDAVANIGRAGLLMTALCKGDYSLMATALDDRIHQPYRKSLIAGYDEVTAACMENGAYGAGLSGAGPTVIAYCKKSVAARLCAAINSDRTRFAGHWKAYATETDMNGAYISEA